MEDLQTRTEHSRSMADAEKFKAIKFLTDIGLLIPVRDLEIYHGRVGNPDNPTSWEVDPRFKNGKNDNGSQNANQRTSLYTGSKEVADDVASTRTEDIIFALLRRTLEDRVRNYTPVERQEWLDRLNSNGLKKADGSPYHTSDMLDRENWIQYETARLRDQLSDAEKEALTADSARSYVPETHQITSPDSDATVLDLNFDIAGNETDEYRKALQTLVMSTSLTEGSPFDFDDRNDTVLLSETFKKRKQKTFISKDKIPDLAVEAGVSEHSALQFASSFNAMLMAQLRPTRLIDKLMNHASDIFFDTFEIDGESKDVPINSEYVQRFLQNAHIIGVKQDLNSLTVNKTLKGVSLFDLGKTVTKEALSIQRKTTWRKLGGLAATFEDHNYGDEEFSLSALLSNPYAKPEDLVAAAMEIPGYKKLFEADAGNWEGYTLQQHTETVLRNFDENFADRIPVQLLAPMRLAIIVHDAGKSAATMHNERYKQKTYNITYADNFLEKLQIDEKLKTLLIAIIGDGEELATRANLGASDVSEQALYDFAQQTLEAFYGSHEITDEQVKSLVEMCKMLQIVDGGAYTSMAVTSQPNGGKYRNAPSFNASFAQPTDLGKHSLQIRQPHEQPAADNLTPQIIEKPSRLHLTTKRVKTQQIPTLKT